MVILGIWSTDGEIKFHQQTLGVGRFFFGTAKTQIEAINVDISNDLSNRGCALAMWGDRFWSSPPSLFKGFSFHPSTRINHHPHTHRMKQLKHILIHTHHVYWQVAYIPINYSLYPHDSYLTHTWASPSVHPLLLVCFQNIISSVFITVLIIPSIIHISGVL
jgi:hypothetical protein